MNETAEEEKTTGEEKPAGKKNAAGRWQKWAFLLLAAVDLVNVVTNVIALINRFNPLRLILAIVWLLAAVCFGIASLCCWKEEKKQGDL